MTDADECANKVPSRGKKGKTFGRVALFRESTRWGEKKSPKIQTVAFDLPPVSDSSPDFPFPAAIALLLRTVGDVNTCDVPTIGRTVSHPGILVHPGRGGMGVATVGTYPTRTPEAKKK